jgi:hypothetical protein
MSYQQALEAAGAKILAFEEFGDYQGDWFSLVEYKGEVGWVSGSYGSCSGCDAFEAEFGWTDDECDTHKYKGHQPECENCVAAKADYATRLADFGRVYLDGLMAQAMAEKVASADVEWDSEGERKLAFVRASAALARLNPQQ